MARRRRVSQAVVIEAWKIYAKNVKRLARLKNKTGEEKDVSAIADAARETATSRHDFRFLQYCYFNGREPEAWETY